MSAPRDWIPPAGFHVFGMGLLALVIVAAALLGIVTEMKRRNLDQWLAIICAFALVAMIVGLWIGMGGRS